MVDWLRQVEFSDREARVSIVPAWRNRRVWRWVAALLLLMALAVVVFRAPLAQLLLPDMRVQRLLDQARTVGPQALAPAPQVGCAQEALGHGHGVGLEHADRRQVLRHEPPGVRR